MYLQNSQISPNSSKFCSFLAKSERFKRLRTRTNGRRTEDGRTHTLFKFEARLHKKPFGQKLSLEDTNQPKVNQFLVHRLRQQESFLPFGNILVSISLFEFRQSPLRSLLNHFGRFRGIHKAKICVWRDWHLAVGQNSWNCYDQNAWVHWRMIHTVLSLLIGFWGRNMINQH